MVRGELSTGERDAQARQNAHTPRPAPPPQRRNHKRPRNRTQRLTIRWCAPRAVTQRCAEPDAPSATRLSALTLTQTLSSTLSQLAPARCALSAADFAAKHWKTLRDAAERSTPLRDGAHGGVLLPPISGDDALDAALHRSLRNTFSKLVLDVSAFSRAELHNAYTCVWRGSLPLSAPAVRMTWPRRTRSRPRQTSDVAKSVVGLGRKGR